MGKKQFARDPLLYIHQPSISTPEAPMQSDYQTQRSLQANTTAYTNTNTITSTTTPKAVKSIEEQMPAKKTQKQPIRKTAFEKQFNKTRQEDTNTAENQKEADTADNQAKTTSSEDTSDKNEPVKFKDRSIEEKIAYFADAPEFAPKMRCEVKTDARTYRGYIADRQEETVYMRTGKRTTNIPMTKITDIRMLGF